MNEKVTGRIVTYTPDPENPVRIDPERLAKLKAMTDEEIDYSDIPPQDVSAWRKMDRSRFVPSGSELILEKDILEFFRRKGDASSAINAVLREYVEAHRDAA